MFGSRTCAVRVSSCTHSHLGLIAAVARRPYESRESHNELSHCSHQSSKHSVTGAIGRLPQLLQRALRPRQAALGCSSAGAAWPRLAVMGLSASLARRAAAVRRGRAFWACTAATVAMSSAISDPGGTGRMTCIAELLSQSSQDAHLTASSQRRLTGLLAANEHSCTQRGFHRVRNSSPPATVVRAARMSCTPQSSSSQVSVAASAAASLARIGRVTQ